MTVKITCKRNYLFDKWHLWIVEFVPDNESITHEEEQAEFDEITKKLNNWIKSYRHIDQKFIEHQRLEFLVLIDMSSIMDVIVNSVRLNSITSY